jgi:hypothetical protein
MRNIQIPIYKLVMIDGLMYVVDPYHYLIDSVFDPRLVHDRELQLHDGRRLVRHDRFEEFKTRHSLSEQQLYDSGLLRIHPAFRIVALAEPPSLGMSNFFALLNVFFLVA